MISLEDITNIATDAHKYERYVAMRCPFHDDENPSLLAYAPRHDGESGFFACKSCGEEGNLYKLREGLEGYIPRTVFRERTSYNSPKLPTDRVEQEELVYKAHRALTNSLSRLGWYLKDRGVDWCIGPCELGWRAGWYVVPIREGDKLKGIVLRAGPQVEVATELRFTQPEGQSPLLYMPDKRLVERSPRLAVCFGMFDALALTALRLPACTTTAGQDSFNPKWLDGIRKPVVVVPDLGEDKAAMRLASSLGWRGSVFNIPYRDGLKDPADYLHRKRGDELVRILTPVLK